MRSALVVFADEVRQNARNNGGGGQDQGVIERKPCSEETLDSVGDALSCGVHFAVLLMLLLEAGRLLTGHRFLGPLEKLLGEARTRVGDKRISALENH